MQSVSKNSINICFVNNMYEAVGRLKKVCRNRREVAVASIYPMLLKNHSSMLLDTASTVLINSDGASYCSLRKASLSVPQERRSSQDSKNLPDSSQDGEVRLFFYRGICTNTPLGGQKARRTKPFPISPFWLSIHIHLSCIPQIPSALFEDQRCHRENKMIWKRNETKQKYENPLKEFKKIRKKHMLR